MNRTQENLFSRQIGAIGKHTMDKLLNLKIVIVGCETIGQECIKCLSLLGIHSLYLYDSTKYTHNKHSDRLYFRSNSKNISLSNVASQFAKELNPAINTIILDSFDKQYLISQNIHGVIMTKPMWNYNNLIYGIEGFCMNNNIKFIFGCNNELYGYIFSNFGNKHCILDKDGEPVECTYIDQYDITSSTITLTVEKMTRNLLTTRGKLVSKENTIEINVLKSTLTTIEIQYTDSIKDFLKKYNNIRFMELKEQYIRQYKSIVDKITETDFKYISTKSSFPDDKSIQVYKKYTSYLLAKKRSMKELNKYTCNIPFFLLESIIGGILAHEVIKITGKYEPLNQEIFFDLSNLRGETFYKSFQNINSQILDKDIIKRIKKTNIFMVGCGALGCELSKNLGMMGFCSSKTGLLTLTDMDKIELSNLNRQFLFRNDNIGQFKSDTIKSRLSNYVPKMNIKTFTKEVSKDSEVVFNSMFWNSQNLIINALDNIEARQYVDSRCVHYQLPLFESGTLGSKCNMQSIIPKQTATYSEITDITDTTIPMCTIKSFPNKIEHCVEWGLETFLNTITQPLQDLNAYLGNSNKFYKQIDSIDNNYIVEKRLLILSEYIELFVDKQFSTFLKLSRFIYNTYFRNPIEDILYSFPHDLKDSSGIPFWSGKKLRPRIIYYKDIDRSFIENLYNILSPIFGLNNWDENVYESNRLQFDSDYNCNTINIDEEKDDIKIEVDDEKIIYIKQKLQSYMPILLNNEITSVTYDKDNDILLRMMVSISNTRAQIYGISEVSYLDIKLISGKIIPALSTTTTVIAGMVMLEILKYFSTLTPCDTNINLGTNEYLLFDSQKPSVTYNNMFHPVYNMNIKTIPYQFNTWDRIRISCKNDSCSTVNELLEFLKESYNIIPNMLTIDKYILYSSITSTNNKPIYDIYVERKIPLYSQLVINICAFENNGTPILCPPIIFSL